MRQFSQSVIVAVICSILSLHSFIYAEDLPSELHHSPNEEPALKKEQRQIRYDKYRSAIQGICKEIAEAGQIDPVVATLDHGINEVAIQSCYHCRSLYLIMISACKKKEKVESPKEKKNRKKAEEEAFKNEDPGAAESSPTAPAVETKEETKNRARELPASLVFKLADFTNQLIESGSLDRHMEALSSFTTPLEKRCMSDIPARDFFALFTDYLLSPFKNALEKKDSEVKAEEEGSGESSPKLNELLNF